jgi:hypothetical protein
MNHIQDYEFKNVFSFFKNMDGMEFNRYLHVFP